MLLARPSIAKVVFQILALVKCELRVVQSSLIGSILSNLREYIRSQRSIQKFCR